MTSSTLFEEIVMFNSFLLNTGWSNEDLVFVFDAYSSASSGDPAVSIKLFTEFWYKMAWVVYPILRQE